MAVDDDKVRAFQRKSPKFSKKIPQIQNIDLWRISWPECDIVDGIGQVQYKYVDPPISGGLPIFFYSDMDEGVFNE